MPNENLESFTNSDGQTITERKAQIAADEQQADAARLSAQNATLADKTLQHPIAGPLVATLLSLRAHYGTINNNINAPASNRAVAIGIANLIPEFLTKITELPGI